ncbi:MAG TPA: hypothetical protein VMW27_14030, partial [Thermoanaerobaculia bacterium]|nr:hypothetical protein [Thermoanaerobaculia bacterium]
LAVHRLAADGPSWETLLADLRTLLAGAPSAPAPLPPAGGLATELAAAASRMLLDEVAPRYGVSPVELLAASLAQAVCVWSGRRHADLAVEVRAAGEPEGAVGGLSDLVPLRLEIEKEMVSALPRVKSELRSAAGSASGEPPTEPALVLRWRGRCEVARPLVSRPVFAARRTFEAVAGIVEGRLRIDWLYDEGAHRPEAVRALVEAAIAALRAWTDQRPVAGMGKLTPSEFPAAGLTQEALDDLLAELTID